MDLSKREKGLFFAVLAVCGVLLLDQYALTPLMEQQDALHVERDKIIADMDRGRKLLAEKKQLAPKWTSMTSSGLKSDPAEAEGDVLHALRDWAKSANFTLSSVKPDRPESKEQLKEIHVQATGTGSMNDVAKFLLKMQNATFPLKLTEFQLGTRNNTTNELALQIKISTLYYPKEKKVAKADTRVNGGTK